MNQIKHFGILLIFAPFVASQLLVAGYFIYLIHQHFPGWTLLAALVLLLVNIGASLLLFRIVKNNAERTQTQERVRLLEEQLQRQMLHYDQFRVDIARTQTIRREIAAELKEANILLGQQQQEAAQSKLEQVASTLTRKKHFCDHRVVDALLFEKGSLCSERNVRLIHTLDVPESLPLSGVELCAVFGNVMDNAITACSAMPAETRFIELKAGVSGGFFIIKARNSAAPPPERNPAERLAPHGWGLSIIREIAARHQGELQTNYQNGVFETTVWLKITEL